MTSTKSAIRRDEEYLPIERVGPNRLRTALSVLLTGRKTPSDPSIDQFLYFIEQQQLSVNQLWAAGDPDQPVAVSLLVPNPGKTAMLFLSPIVDHPRVGLGIRLAQKACASQNPQQLQLIQSLLDPSQVYERQALEAAGFRRLSDLIYMERCSNHSPPLSGFSTDGTKVLRWSESNRRAFEEALLASYENTLDCPGLVGLRSIDDVIAGHMATGQYNPQLWFTLWNNNQPIGVMLLNQVTRRPSFELIYLGVSQPFRQKGWGRQLLTYAVTIASERGGSSIVLAVDQHNRPALRLYRSLEFNATAHKTAMILTLK